MLDRVPSVPAPKGLPSFCCHDAAVLLFGVLKLQLVPQAPSPLLEHEGSPVAHVLCGSVSRSIQFEGSNQVCTWVDLVGTWGGLSVYARTLVSILAVVNAPAAKLRFVVNWSVVLNISSCVVCSFSLMW
jgi:hypothetical protein